MLGIVPQSCRSPQCFGCTFTFPAAFRLPPGSPAGEIARPTVQGKRQEKPGTECSRQRPFPRHPFAGDCRAGVHARRESFRPPLPSVCRQAPRRAKSPALQYKANGRRNREQNARGNVHFPGTHLWRIVGRAFTPAAVTSGCPSLPGPMPALFCKASRDCSVSGPMLGIVLQSCRSPQCLGCASIFPAAFRLPPGSPAGEIARPTIQGKRQAKPETLPLWPTFLSRHPFAGDCRAGVHARRGDFRLPQPSRSNARFALQSFPQSRRFRADENHRPLRKRSGDPQSFRLVLYCPPPDF